MKYYTVQVIKDHSIRVKMENDFNDLVPTITWLKLPAGQSYRFRTKSDALNFVKGSNSKYPDCYKYIGKIED